ncbi:AAA family ATPase [Piscibacillus salipiscarius]|uniref:CpaE family protein n=1 Tax=Piscibacillus salipiscarius TaxID=299480 RepID=A0ABW5QA26_9BACI|nr:AAA family ATPase [Piscibacillus salipiscarius]
MSKVNDLYVIGNHTELKDTLRQQISESFNLLEVSINDFKKIHAQIIIVANQDDSTVDLVQSALAEFPSASVVCVNGVEDFDLLRSLNRLGVTDFYVIPGEELILKERLEELAQDYARRDLSINESEGFKRGGGKVFAFYSGSGGTGKSLISATYAQTLKLESTGKVLFIDLNLQYGGAETYLGIESNRTIIDLLPVINELGEHHIRNVSERESHSELNVLISPKDAEMAEKITEDFVLRLIRASKRNFDFIVIDLPNWMDEKTLMALEESDRIYYVMDVNTVSMRVLKSVESLFTRLGINTKEKLEVVINMKSKDTELTKKDLERFVSYPVAAEIRRDYKNIQAKINHGEPLRKEPKEKKLTPFSKDIHKWVNSMLK